jgi:small subunit ribosomal protein S6
MEKSNRIYEGMFVLPQTFVREDKERAFELLTSALAKHDAEVKYMDIWSERSLAYEINHVREASYVLVYFEAESESIAKIERTFRITDNILRLLVVRPEKGFELDTFIKEESLKKEEQAKLAEETKGEEVKS